MALVQRVDLRLGHIAPAPRPYRHYRLLTGREGGSSSRRFPGTWPKPSRSFEVVVLIASVSQCHSCSPAKDSVRLGDALKDGMPGGRGLGGPGKVVVALGGGEALVTEQRARQL